MRLRHLLLGVTVGLLAAGSTWAQQPPAAGGPGGGGFGRPANIIMMISLNKPLQDELKMDGDQVEKVSAAGTKVREDMREEMTKLRNRESTQEERAAVTKKTAESYTKAISAVLKPEQMKRLTQIENQQAGLDIFTKEDALKALKLTGEQKEKITSIAEGLTKEINELRGGGGRGGFDPQTPTKIQAMRKEAMEKAEAVLKDDQKSAFKDLVGAPFQLQIARGGFGGAAPGAPGGFGGGIGGGFARILPGQVLSAPVQASLKLSDEQKKQVEELQKEIDAKLEKILTEEQNKQLKDMQQGGPRRGNRPAPGTNPPPRQ
jgi:Spy/CpxP family protein refolding chaperone